MKGQHPTNERLDPVVMDRLRSNSFANTYGNEMTEPDDVEQSGEGAAFLDTLRKQYKDEQLDYELLFHIAYKHLMETP